MDEHVPFRSRKSNAIRSRGSVHLTPILTGRSISTPGGFVPGGGRPSTWTDGRRGSAGPRPLFRAASTRMIESGFVEPRLAGDVPKVDPPVLCSDDVAGCKRRSHPLPGSSARGRVRFARQLSRGGSCSNGRHLQIHEGFPISFGHGGRKWSRLVVPGRSGCPASSACVYAGRYRFDGCSGTYAMSRTWSGATTGPPVCTDG